MTTRLRLTDLEKKQLLSISRDAIRSCFKMDCHLNLHYGKNKAYFECEENLLIKYSNLKAPILQEIISCFVTLYILEDSSRKLRGCIGTLEAHSGETLLENLISNSILAAFGDSRFEPLEETELEKSLIEISILSKPEPINFYSKEELYALIEGKGVVLKSGTYKATFLPQVWDQVDGPESFLRYLARKAGIPSSNYLNATYKIYEVLAFEEEVSES